MKPAPGEIENLKKGNFDDDPNTAIINNQKKNKIKASESYGSRGQWVDGCIFTNELDWQQQVAYTDQLSKNNQGWYCCICKQIFW